MYRASVDLKFKTYSYVVATRCLSFPSNSLTIYGSLLEHMAGIGAKNDTVRTHYALRCSHRRQAGPIDRQDDVEA